ncbi:hypothetical protein FRC07_014166 [Ceratobasidium sp. 392]|nr:hypothetical protein FRC07_014166 [Ceratobasidium sp. 392]
MSDSTVIHEVKLSAFRFVDQDAPPPRQSDKHSDAAPNSSFTINGDRAHHDPGRLGNYSRLAADKPGQELASDAIVWNLYVQEANEYDQELVKGRHASLDMLLLFATLFSAILTAFLIESKQLLQEDPADASVTLLLLIAQSQQRLELGLPPPSGSSTPVNLPGFTPLSSARWINGIWFTSLAISLSAALVAMLGKEWLTAFLASRPRSPHSHALLRQSRLEGLERWWALHIIALLPSLLHLSLLLFSVGLVLYLWTMDTGISVVIACVTGLTFLFYLLTAMLGATYEFCPFTTEISAYLRASATKMLGRPSIKSHLVHSTHMDLQALLWLAHNSRDPEVVDYAYQALAGLRNYPDKVHQYNSSFKNKDPNALNDAYDDVPVQLDKHTTITSLLCTALGRFERVINNRKALSINGGAHIARYTTAVSNMMSRVKRVNLKVKIGRKHWWQGVLDNLETNEKQLNQTISPLKPLALIESLWTENVPPLDANTYASLLAAEMEFLNLAALDLAKETSRSPSSKPTVGDFNLYPPTPVQLSAHVIDMPSIDGSSDLHYRLAILRACYSRTLVRISQLLRFHMYGEVALEVEPVIAIMDSICTTARRDTLNPLDSISTHHPTTDGLGNRKYHFAIPISHNNSVTILPDDLRMSPLGSIILILRIRSGMNEDQLLRTRMSTIDAFSALAPVLLQQILELDRAELQDAYDFRAWPYKPKADSLGVGYIVVRQMLLTLRYLGTRLRSTGEHTVFCNNVLQLIFEYVEDAKRSGYHHGPRLAIAHGGGDLVPILDFASSSEQNLAALPDNVVGRLLGIIRLPLTPGLLTLYDTMLMPSCFPPLIRMTKRPSIDLKLVKDVFDSLIRRIQNGANQLELQQDTTWNRVPSLDYLDYFARTDQGFSALVEVSSRNDIRDLVADAIIKLVYMISRKDLIPGLEASELHEPAVAGFLDAVSLVLQSLLGTTDHKEAMQQFSENAFRIMIAASANKDSKILIVAHPAYQSLWNAVESIQGYHPAEELGRMNMRFVSESS